MGAFVVTVFCTAGTETGAELGETASVVVATSGTVIGAPSTVELAFPTEDEEVVVGATLTVTVEATPLMSGGNEEGVVGVPGATAVVVGATTTGAEVTEAARPGTVGVPVVPIVPIILPFAPCT